MKAAPYSPEEKQRWEWAADVIAAAMEYDENLARSIGDGPLEPIAEGASSMVFTAPRIDRVVRLTSDTSMTECEIMQNLVGESQTGWPRVYDVAYLRAPSEEVAELLPDDWEPDAELCIGVVERVTPASRMDARTKRYKDVFEAAFLVKRYFPTLPQQLPNISDQAYRWALQLHEGLMAIDRQSGMYELDLYNAGNWGLDANDNAVWVDFGV